MKTVTIECRQINEWDDETRAQIIEKHRYINDDHDWWEIVIDDAKEIGAKLGIRDMKIMFSGFGSQGDGACFTGWFERNPDAPRVVREYAPFDTQLHHIADNLASLGGSFRVSIEHYGHYCHENSVEFYFDNPPHDSSAVKYWLRAFMRWIYRQLEKEYEYRISDEAVRETLAANEYEFDADGRIW